MGNPTKQEIEEIAKTIPRDGILVLDHIQDDEYVQRIADIAYQLELTYKRVRSILRSLHNVGAVNFTTLTRDDSYLVCGSGYWCNTTGRRILAYLNKEGEWS